MLKNFKILGFSFTEIVIAIVFAILLGFVLVKLPTGYNMYYTDKDCYNTPIG